MYSYSYLAAPEAAGLPQYPHFWDVLEAIKANPGMRAMLDGQAGFSRLNPMEQQAHLNLYQLWDSLRRTNPREYEHLAREQSKTNARRLLALLGTYDPLFKTTWRMLGHMFAMLPSTAERLVKMGTHADPSMFLKLYGEMREWAREVELRKHRRGTARAQVRAQAQARANAPTARPVPKPGGASEAQRRADLEAFLTRVKSGRVLEGDLMRYLELAMRRDSDESDSAGGR